MTFFLSECCDAIGRRLISAKQVVWRSTSRGKKPNTCARGCGSEYVCFPAGLCYQRDAVLGCLSINMLCVCNAVDLRHGRVPHCTKGGSEVVGLIGNTTCDDCSFSCKGCLTMPSIWKPGIQEEDREDLLQVEYRRTRTSPNRHPEAGRQSDEHIHLAQQNTSAPLPFFGCFPRSIGHALFKGSLPASENPLS